MVKPVPLNLQNGWRKYGQGLAAALALAIFLPALASWFTGEDFTFILPASTGKPFYETWQNLFYRPLPNLLWKFDFAVWGLNAPGYHLTNLIIHAANVFLMGWLVRKSVRNDFAGVAAAGLFALTPVHTEPVVWLAGRPDLLATFFSLLTLILMQQFTGAKRLVVYVAALLAFAAALFSKESAAGIPLVLVAFGLMTQGWPRSSVDWRNFAVKFLPFFVVETIYWLVRYMMLGSLGSYGNDGLLNIAWNLTFGLWQPLLFPFNFESAGWLVGGLLSAILLIFYGWLATPFFRHFAFKTQLKHLAFPLLLIYGGLAPALTLPPVGLNLSQSRLLYLPSVGFCWLLAWLIRLKLLDIKKTALESSEPENSPDVGSARAKTRVRLEKLLLGLVPGVIYLVGLGLAFSPWLVAGSEASGTFDQLQRAGLPFQAGDYIYYEGLPDSFQGAYIWRNGLGEASSMLLTGGVSGTRRLPDQLIDYNKAVQGQVWFVRYRQDSPESTPHYLLSYSLSNQPNLPVSPAADAQTWNFEQCPVEDWKFTASQGELVCVKGQGLQLKANGQKTSLALTGPDLKPQTGATALDFSFTNYVDYDFSQLQVFGELSLGSSTLTLLNEQPIEIAADGKQHEYHFYLPLPTEQPAGLFVFFDFQKFRSNILWKNIAVRYFGGT